MLKYNMILVGLSWLAFGLFKQMKSMNKGWIKQTITHPSYLFIDIDIKNEFFRE